MISKALTAGLAGYLILVVAGLHLGLAFSVPVARNYEFKLILYHVSSYIGTIIGAAICGILLTMFGIKVPVGLGALFLIIAGSLYITLNTLPMLIMGRILVGCAGGIALVTEIIYLGENSPSARRGRYIVYISAAIYLGLLLQFIIGQFVMYYELNMITGIVTVALGTIAGVSVLISLKESPYHLIYKDNDKEAIKNLAFLTGYESNSREVRREFDEINKSIIEECQNELPVHKELLHNNRKAFIISLIFQVIYSSSFHIFLIGYNSTYVISPLFAPNRVNMIFVAFLVSAAAKLLGAILAASFVDQYGRRILLIISGLIGAVCLVIIAGFLYSDIKLNPGFRESHLTAFSYIASAAVIVYDIVTALGFGCVPNIILGEAFTEPTKVFAVSVCIIIQAFTGFLFDVINDIFFKDLTMELNLSRYIIVALFLLIGSFISFKILPETKQKTHRELMDAFKTNKN